MALSILRNPNILIAKQYTVNGIPFVFRKYGRVVVVTASGQPTSAITTTDYAGTESLDSEYYPVGGTVFHVLARPGIGMQINISSAGEFKYGFASATIATTVNVYCSFSYISAT